MGTPEFALPALDRIHHSHHSVVGVVSQPDRPRGRGRKLSPTPVKQYALDHGLEPVFQPHTLKDPQFVEELRALEADTFVVVAFRILPEIIFTMPPKGTVNLHPSLLPQYRGAAPLNWAIINGESKTGITTIFIKKEIDAGNIILQREAPVFPEDTAGTLHDRLSQDGAGLLLESLALIEQGTPPTMAQDESKVSPAPKLTREMCHLNFDQPARDVKNWIHGLSPIPGAFTHYQDQLIKLFAAAVIPNAAYQKASPGTILKAEKAEFHIACNPGVIAVMRLQLQGRKAMQTREFLSGYELQTGEILR